MDFDYHTRWNSHYKRLYGSYLLEVRVGTGWLPVPIKTVEPRELTSDEIRQVKDTICDLYPEADADADSLSDVRQPTISDEPPAILPIMALHVALTIQNSEFRQRMEGEKEFRDFVRIIEEAIEEVIHQAG